MRCLAKEYGLKEYTSKDLLYVVRGKAAEIWTLRPFEKNTLVIIPVAIELNEWYWTEGRSVEVKNVFGPQQGTDKRCMPIDGRLRVVAKEDRMCHMFVVARIKEGVPNLITEYATLALGGEINVPGITRRKFEIDGNLCHRCQYI